jgi:hypothetical protein
MKQDVNDQRNAGIENGTLFEDAMASLASISRDIGRYYRLRALTTLFTHQINAIDKSPNWHD